MREILLIDDCPSIQMLVTSALTSEDVNVTAASDGEAGLRAAIRAKPDLILLDVQMPGMSGIEVCELLKVLAETSQIPVIFLSAAASPNERVVGLESGASDYIVKPFHPAELQARVRIALGYRTLLERESKRAMRDGLTGLWNRAYLNERLASEFEACTRHQRDLSAIMIDLDHFKSLNDRFGHAGGDEALRSVGKILKDVCRREDVACRYGGEEFAILCPDVTMVGAATLAERLREKIETTIVHCGNDPIRITASFGVAGFSQGIGLLEAADGALYAAKKSGRNRVRSALTDDCASEPALRLAA